MIAGIFHKGSGLGNQLHRYVMTRVLALDKGLEFGMVCPENFKGSSFMNLDMGNPVPFPTTTEEPSGKVRVITDFPLSDWPLFEENTSDYDWGGIKLIRDNTIVDGEWQGEKYFEHHLDEIREWLKVESVSLPDDGCIINFRGGEYQYFPELFLTQDYWDDAVARMRQINPKMKFNVHTDDPKTAVKFFPEFGIIHDISYNWRCINSAKYLILANSSFGILPALLNQNAEHIIAPKGWARRNTGEWSLRYNKYERFEHI